MSYTIYMIDRLTAAEANLEKENAPQLALIQMNAIMDECTADDENLYEEDFDAIYEDVEAARNNIQLGINYGVVKGRVNHMLALQSIKRAIKYYNDL